MVVECVYFFSIPAFKPDPEITPNHKVEPVLDFGFFK